MSAGTGEGVGMDAVGIVGLVAGAVAVAVGVARSVRPAKEPRPVPIGDTRMPDGDWLSAGAVRYERLAPKTGASAEAMAAAGNAHRRAGDPAAALLFYLRAIGLYADDVVGETGGRRPDPGGRVVEPADHLSIDRFLSTLELIRDQRPAAPVAAPVLEATYRLRTITAARKDAGLDATRYLDALDRLAHIAPDVDVSGVGWTPSTHDEG